ncbi:trypsin-1-like [Chrysoperla carnea]|uniref:trypsin-1-like n=1 Tax=Chrysoperla carnea TaxID=189513 RepID=UPI001D0909C1|nr:trypsin-1-like [Chrysoperla carnea]
MKLIVFTLIVSVTLTVITGKSLKPLTYPEGRIVGGKNVTIEEVPYQVALKVGGSPWCGGTIISDIFILTAAHCSKGVSERSLSVHAGSTFPHTYENGNVHRVKRIYVHEKYSSSTLDFDVAILELETPLQFSNTIKSLSLPGKDEFLEENETVLISGWGTLEEGGQLATVLQAVEIPVVNQNVCQQLYSNFLDVTPRMLCAGYIEGGKDHCNGDSGGPVVSNGKVHGIVSWANGCARPNFPGVNTRVTAVREWIRSKIGF